MISFLKKHTVVYRIARRSYRSFISLVGSLFGTRFEERRWASQSSSYKNGSDAIHHPHRNYLVTKISEYYPIKNLLEVGCGNGPNLYLLSKKFPEAELTGVDINPWSVENGNEWLKREGLLNIHLSVGKADELEKFLDKSFDIVLTDAVLMYVGPDKIKKIMKEMIRITRKGLFFIEWHSFDSQNSLGVYERHWRRNYESLLNEINPDNDVTVFKLPDGGGFKDELWMEWGALIEVKLKENDFDKN